MRRNSYCNDFEDSAGNALIDAINRGKAHLAKFILDAVGRDAVEIVNFRSFKGKTPLIRTVYMNDDKNRQQTMLMLLSKNAEPNIQDDVGRTALSYACELQHNDSMRLLIRWNADPELKDLLGMTPLMYCAKVGNGIGVTILIKCFRKLGCLCVDSFNKDGYTALHLAARAGHAEVASQLAVEGQASVTRVDEHHGKTAEQWARLAGCRTPQLVLFSMSSQKLQQRERVVSLLRRHDDRTMIPSVIESPRKYQSKMSNGLLSIDFVESYDHLPMVKKSINLASPTKHKKKKKRSKSKHNIKTTAAKSEIWDDSSPLSKSVSNIKLELKHRKSSVDSINKLTSSQYPSIDQHPDHIYPSDHHQHQHHHDHQQFHSNNNQNNPHHHHNQHQHQHQHQHHQHHHHIRH